MYRLRVGLLSEIENTSELTQELVDFITRYEWKEIYIHPEYKEEWFLKVSRYAKKQSFVIPDYWVEEVVIEDNSFFKNINQTHLIIYASIFIIISLVIFWISIPEFTPEQKERYITEYQEKIDVEMREIEKQINEEALYQIKLKEELFNSEIKVWIYEKRIERLRKEKFTINFK